MNFYTYRDEIWVNPNSIKDKILVDKSILEIKSYVGETLFHYCAIENKINLVEMLYEYGSNINTQDNFGSTPLMHAIQLKHAKMIDLLLKYGADVDLKTINGDTSLSYAVMDDDMETANKILPHCKNVIQFYFDGLNAMQINENPYSEIRKFIIKMGLINPYE